MPRHALKPSPTLARMLRQRRKELGWSTRDVVLRSAEFGEPIPRVTLQKIESGTQEPGIRRFYTLVRLYSLPLELIPDLLELESLSATPPAETDTKTLVKEAREAFERGDAGAGLARVFAIRQLVPKTHEERADRHRALLTVAAAASWMGRVRLARGLVEGVLSDEPDETLLPFALLHCAVAHADLGSLDVSLGILARATELIGNGNPRVLARIEHQRGTTLTMRGEFDKARACLDLAETLYKRPEDDSSVVRLYGARIELLIATGHIEEALQAATHELDEAESRGHKLIAGVRMLDVGRCLLTLGRAAEAKPVLQSAVGYCLISKDRSTELKSHYWLYKTCLALRRPDDAGRAMQAALDLLDRTDEVSFESRQLKELLRPRGLHAKRKSMDRRHT